MNPYYNYNTYCFNLMAQLLEQTALMCRTIGYCAEMQLRCSQMVKHMEQARRDVMDVPSALVLEFKPLLNRTNPEKQ